MSALKASLRAVTPPLLWHGAHLLKRRFNAPEEKLSQFEGPFTSWTQAVAQSATWDAPEITELSLRSALAAKEGKVACEHDGVPFKDPLYSQTMLAFLLLASRDGVLNIIDFGGGLGSGYFQNARLLRLMSSPVQWHIVERPIFVKLGTEHFQNDTIRFYSSLGEAIRHSKSNSLIFSGSLQYVDEPFELIDEAGRSAIRILAFDRTLTWERSDDGIFLQRPDPKAHYRATYACRCFSKERLTTRLAELGFALVEEFTRDRPADFCRSGMIFVRDVTPVRAGAR